MHLHSTSREIGVNARIIRTDALPDIQPEIIMSPSRPTIVSKSINKAEAEGHHFRGREGRKEKDKRVRAAHAPAAFVGHLFSEVKSHNSLQTACL